MPDWDVIKKEYVSTKKTLSELSTEFGVSVPLLKKKCAQGKWTELRNQVVTKKQKRMVTKVTNGAVKKESAVQACADKTLDSLSRFIENNPELSPKDYQCVASALKNLKEIKHDLTAYELREQDARIKALEKQTEVEKEDNDIRVEFVNRSWDTH